MIPEYIILHHSLTKDSQTVSWQAIRRYHKYTLGWSDIGYHFGIELINNHLEILIGRLWNISGAHCKEQGMNGRSVGVCVVGNYDIDYLPSDTFDLTVKLVKQIQDTWSVSKTKVMRHSDFATYKSCPGINFPYQQLLDKLI
jgi:hypothetical protein